MVTIKLTPTNYLLWRYQFVSLIESKDLMGYLDRSLPVPIAQTRSKNNSMIVILHTKHGAHKIAYYSTFCTYLLPR